MNFPLVFTILFPIFFAFGILLREYVLPRRYDPHVWVLALCIFGVIALLGSAAYHNRPESFFVPFVSATLIGFFWFQLNRLAKRWVPPRLWPYIAIGMALALFAAVVGKSTFFLSAFVAGTLFVLLGGLIKYALRLTKFK